MNRLMAAAFLAATLPFHAMACSPLPHVPGAPPPPTLAQLLEAAPVAFVGRVTSVTPDTTTFAVERPIHGVTGKEITLPSGGNTCMVMFMPGTRWLYLGADARSGTLPIIPETMEQARALLPGLE